MASHDFPIEAALHALGAELRRRKASARILVVGGANLWLRGLIDRPTMDIDVLAEVGKDGRLLYPDPLPATLREAAEAVQRALGLPDALWLNGVVATSWQHQWPIDLPHTLLDDTEWRTYGPLEVGLAGRSILIPFKLHAVADCCTVHVDDLLRVSQVEITSATARKHANDLAALAPSDAEWEAAQTWVLAQDPSPQFPYILRAVLILLQHATL